MPQFSQTSAERLGQCDVTLQGVLQDFIQYFDFSVITGHRTEEEQNEKVAQNLSQVEWPNSKHNSQPSKAVDIAPYDSRFGALFGGDKQIAAISNWLREQGKGGNREERKERARQFVRDQYSLMAGLLLAEAQHRNINLRWGGDWDRDFDTLDNDFDDLGHFEID